MNKNWDWEDISRELKAEDEKRIAARRAAKEKERAIAHATAHATAHANARANAPENAQAEKDNAEGKQSDARTAAKVSEKKREARGSSARAARPASSVRTGRTVNADRRGGSAAGGRRRKISRRKSKLFRKLLLIYLLLLAILTIVAAVYVYRTVEEIDANDPKKMIEEHIANLTDDELCNLFGWNPLYETKEGAALATRRYINDASLTVTKTGDYEYEVTDGARRLFQVQMNLAGTGSLFYFMPYELLEIGEFTSAGDTQLYRYEIIAPDTCEIFVNGREIAEPVKSEVMKGFADVQTVQTVPVVNTYVLDHLTAVPEIRITDGGRDLAFTMAEVIDVTEAYEEARTCESIEESGVEFDALLFAQTWDLFLTRDLSGTMNGYNQLEPYFIEGTAIEQKALALAQSTDTAGIELHTLGNPPFGEQLIGRVIVYSENAISYDVYLEKNVHLTDTGEDRSEVFAATITLVRYEDGWRVADILDKVITE